MDREVCANSDEGYHWEQGVGGEVTAMVARLVYPRFLFGLIFRPKNLKSHFKKPGPDGMGGYRAVIISGPPGIGKTTSAHLVARLEGYDILEYNASDTRNEKLLRV